MIHDASTTRVEVPKTRKATSIQNNIETVDSESQPQQPPAKRRKHSSSSSSSSQSGLPPEFWDKLSRVPLSRGALRELNRRTIQPIVPQQRAKRDIEDSQVKQLQRFARYGGPDLRRIRNYPEPANQVKMRPNVSTHKKLTPYDAAFEQTLIDNGIYPPGYSNVEPGNLDEVTRRLGRCRASVSSSKFSHDDLLHFRRKNFEAPTEAQVMSQVFPTILSEAYIPSGFHQLFGNLEPFCENICAPKPDHFNGSRTTGIELKVRHDLDKYIIPSTQKQRPALPNFFVEVKGTDGKISEAKRQVMHDLAVGARGMLKMQSYELNEPAFDNSAYAFGCTYHDGNLSLYAAHPTKPGDADGKPEYHTTKIGGFDLTSDIDSYLQGIAAFRNLQDLAKEMRDDFIARANKRARGNKDEPEARSSDPRSTSSN
ncbi:hypothetical protein GQ44DRAFT_831942 [Phaeosphaeriaceae sp. PMI808]|nr:hypothetical protein GQ44DRAFT_831942 [Phaeosphaeriaceae sp. PMI808]